MVRIVPILIALVIALGGGVLSVPVMLENTAPIGAIKSGPWTAFPQAGTHETDPYSRAHFIREGGVPLGRAEGIVFTAREDSAGRALQRECAYRIRGPMPLARYWMLHAADANGTILPPIGRRIAAINSELILRQAGNSFYITASARPAPGNWLATSGSGAMQFVLTLLDTPITSASTREAPELPPIIRTACDA